MTIAQFPGYFARFLGMFFGSGAAYWDSCPIKPIDGVAFTRDHDFRDWTPEARCRAYASIGEALLFVDKDLYDTWRKTLKSQGAMYPVYLRGPDISNVDENPGRAAERYARDVALGLVKRSNR
jgi:hypothetical protein